MPPKTPLILSFDTSAAHCAAALVCGDEVLGAKSESMTKGQAERLIPLLEEVLTGAGKHWRDLDAIAVGTGPGNFTGVRISVSAARGLAVSLAIPAIGVTVFEGLAFGTKGHVRVSLDGRREQIFWQDFIDGIAVNEPTQSAADEARPACAGHIGFMADRFAIEVGGVCLSLETEVDPIALAKVAAGRFGKETAPRPAPLYLRSADAALPSDPPPEILP